MRPQPIGYADDLGSLQFEDLRAYYAVPGHSPTTMAQALLARIAQHSAANVWISVADEYQLLAAASALMRQWPDPATRPALWGMPIAVKDNVDVLGLPTTAGCPDFGYRPDDDAELVARLREAGALIVGKTNMDQFASGLTGTRSAYGICRSPFDENLIAGGSSSGSALAVALGLAAAAIGTDTAGSGRVPAAFTNIVGLKPSRGLVSSRGVVPACRSLDCPSVFALSVADAAAVLAAIAGPDPDDAWSRVLTIPSARPAAIPAGLRIAFCELSDEPIDPSVLASYDAALDTLADLGAELVPTDVTPFRQAGDLLYDGPWVAERLTGLEPWIEDHLDSLLPVTATVLDGARQKTAVEAFRGFHRLTELAAQVAPLWSRVDAMVLPTVPSTPTVAETVADPHAVNTRMGRYTMFANLLDLAALAVPASIEALTGLPYGVTFYGPAGTDGLLASIGTALQQARPLSAGATAHPVHHNVASAAGIEATADTVLVAVVGAHRTGQPLNGQLVELGAQPVGITLTAPNYRLYALASGPADPVRRPGLLRVLDDGRSIEVELHRMPIASIGQLLASIPSPLGLGTITLLDDTAVIGFLCEAAEVSSATDISEFKSWPNYVLSTQDL